MDKIHTYWYDGNSAHSVNHHWTRRVDSVVDFTGTLRQNRHGDLSATCASMPVRQVMTRR